MAGDQEGAEGREEIAPIEPAAATAVASSPIPATARAMPAMLTRPIRSRQMIFGDHRDKEYEEVVEDAGPRDAGALDAEDEAEVGQSRARPRPSCPAREYTGIEIRQTPAREHDQHDQGRQRETDQHK